ncbi:MAG: FAD-dependent oxidoreductase [Cryobacterium sp.]|nr:FAD-dependent oxidoreductase [Cryobacterium sp.]
MVGPALFSPLAFGTVTVPNRIMQTAHSKGYSDRTESQREIDYFVRRARGGCGLFVAGNHLVHPTSSVRWFQDAYRTESVEHGRALTEAVHGEGARILVQLNHHGAQAGPDGPEGPRPVFSASRLLSPSTGHATRAASAADIRSFVDAWARSAELAREAGFDGVEVHMAHSYLLHEFLSPLYNARTDEYGGDLEGRTRFPREVLRAVRAAVGDDYTVGIRIVADEAHPGGLGPAELREVIARLRAETRLDFLDLAAGGYHNVHYVFPSSPMPTAWLREQTAAVKAENPDIAVFGVGSALSVEDAEEVITSGIADMVALTRAQIADPDLALKLRTGQTDRVRHCIRLNQGCLGRGSTGLPMSCTVNPVAGREADRGERAATGVQRWVVVGGGPAGMRAAVELAESGHRVTLFERSAQLGGQLLVARRVPGRESIQLLIDDLTRDLNRLKVDVRLGVDGDSATVAALDPEGVVLATGSRAPAVTSLSFAATAPGVLGRTVSVAEAVLNPTGPRAVVIDDDGSNYGAAAALALAAAGVELHVVTVFENLFPHVRAGYDRPLLLERLSHGTLHRYESTVATARRGRALTLRDTLTGEITELGDVDVVVSSTPREPVAEPFTAPPSVRVVEIGDRVYPRNIDAAIFDAVELAHSVGRTPTEA